MHYRKMNKDLESNLLDGWKGVERSKNQGRTLKTIITFGILLMGVYSYLFQAVVSQNHHHYLQHDPTKVDILGNSNNKNIAVVRSPSGDHVDMETRLDELLMDVGGVNRRLVDLGAAVRDNDPCFSLIDKGWSGLLVDGDQTQPMKWSHRFPTGDYKGVVSYILADSIVGLLNQYGFHKDTNIGLLKIDIDSFDCYVMQAILNAGIRPKVIVMETNVKYPPHIRFAMQPGFVQEGKDSSALKQIPFDSEKRGHIYGCSLGYQVIDLMLPNGYKIHYMDWNNVMYVLDTQDDVPSKAHYVEKVAYNDLKSWYDYAYWNRPNRNKEFGFNSKISYWNKMNPSELLVEIKKTILPLTSHANQHIRWNGEHYCFDNNGYLRIASTDDDGSRCSLTHS